MFEWLFGSAKAFNADRDIGDLSGKVILVTGGNTGLGEEALRQFAKHNPKQLWLAARTRSKAEQAIERIKEESPEAPISFLELDLTKFSSIKAAAEDFQRRSDRLDILLNNAGVMMMPYSKTEDGYEIQFGTNHMGHALLTKLLMPTLLRTAEEPQSDVRVIDLSSQGHEFSAFTGGVIFDQDKAESVFTQGRYGSAKLANILHARGLRKRYPQLTCAAIHPGVIQTQLYDSVLKNTWFFGSILPWLFSTVFASVQQGTLNSLWAATAPKQEVGKSYYFEPVGKPVKGNWHARNEKMADKLWDYTEEEFKKHGV